MVYNNLIELDSFFTQNNPWIFIQVVAYINSSLLVTAE